MKEIYIKNKQTFEFIKNGSKKVEGRLNKSLFKKLKVNENIIFKNNKKSVIVKIVNIKKFNSFENLLKEMENVLPCINNLNDGINYYHTLYSLEKESKYGVLGINFQTIY